VGLKRETASVVKPQGKGSNRTNVGLKRQVAELLGLSEKGSNRTNVGLKLWSRATSCCVVSVQIAPMWD